jgi:hypothetical protein
MTKMLAPRFALAALLAFGLAGCDNSGTEPTLLDRELDGLRIAMAPFHNFDSAVAAGYGVEVVNPETGSSYFPGMGVHYLNPALLDDQFEIERPEILLFAENEHGEMQFVAVEYAIPIADLENPPPAPSGFTGASDEWVINTTFGLWTLHAWVGMENPAGVFASHNPRLH